MNIGVRCRVANLIFILGEPISRPRWLSVFFGIGGALLIAKPTFAGLGRRQAPGLILSWS